MSYKFFQNKECEYYPCHKGIKEINCLFCFCPLYAKNDCGGNYKILENGVKDCSSCTFPHIRENYEKVIEKLKQCQ